MKILIITHIPSPYQVELFNAIAEQGLVHLYVAYLHARSTAPTASLWCLPDLNHSHLILSNKPEHFSDLEQLVDAVDLVIFNYYQHPIIPALIQRRVRSFQSWCFWGERPGYHHLGQIGTYYRKWKLSALHRSKVPIWGIGQWAIAQYRREFGDRLYLNLPYFSDLHRFSLYRRKEFTTNQTCWFLYSGSLIHRKGVDLLAHAFSQLADELPFVKLRLIGEGRLRPQLAAALSKYGERVQFSGFQSWENLPQFYQSAHIMCVPSRYDGWAMVVPEGLASGLPVISTDHTGAALELIDPDRSGWRIPAGDAKALYQAMKQAALLTPAEQIERSKLAQCSVSGHMLRDGIERFHDAIQKTLDWKS